MRRWKEKKKQSSISQTWSVNYSEGCARRRKNPTQIKIPKVMPLPCHSCRERKEIWCLCQIHWSISWFGEVKFIPNARETNGRNCLPAAGGTKRFRVCLCVHSLLRRHSLCVHLFTIAKVWESCAAFCLGHGNKKKKIVRCWWKSWKCMHSVQKVWENRKSAHNEQFDGWSTPPHIFGIHLLPSFFHTLIKRTKRMNLSLISFQILPACEDMHRLVDKRTQSLLVRGENWKTCGLERKKEAIIEKGSFRVGGETKEEETGRRSPLKEEKAWKIGSWEKANASACMLFAEERRWKRWHTQQSASGAPAGENVWLRQQDDWSRE